MAYKHQKVAFAYDFDGTLAPGNMQELSFIPALKMKKDTFWRKVKKDASNNNADEILCYMRRMIDEARHLDISIHRNSIVDHGNAVELFSGLDNWFDRINIIGRNLSLEIEHYIISSGLQEMIEGTKIYSKFTKVYASSFSYSADGIPLWPALSVNYTNKTQYLFRINKGALDTNDAKGVNQFVKPEERPITFSRMVYFGDGDTDVPCMRLVKEQGGHSIAVYAPSTKGAKDRALRLLRDGRVNGVVRADYSKGSDLDSLVKAILAKIQADISLQRQFAKLG